MARELLAALTAKLSTDAAEVAETPAPAAAPCVALVVVSVADAEPQPEPAAAPVRDAADIEAELTAEPVPMLPDPPAVVYISGPVPPSPRSRRPAPRLRPIFRRLWRVAAVVVPLVVLAILTASTAADNNHQAPAAGAVAMTPAAALPVAVDADTLQVVELPPVTVTAPRTPASQKTASTVADASPTDEPTADTPASQKTDADTLPDTLQPDSQPHGLTICAGTAWAYTMMNWA